MKSREHVFFQGISIIKPIIYALIIACVLTVVDIYDVPSTMIIKYGVNISIMVSVTILIVLILIMVNRHFFDMFCIPCGNVVDEVLISLVLTDVIYYVCLSIREGWIIYKSCVAVAILILGIIYLFARYMYCYRKYEQSLKRSTNIIDLYQLFVGEINNNKEPLMFSDEASQQDLLNREGVINLLQNSILHSNANHVYVIGVKGAWGSGKTTLLNFVKDKICNENPEILIIDKFDPWVFGSQEALLGAMYDEILGKIGLVYSSYNNKVIENKIKKTVTDKYELAGILTELVAGDCSDYSVVKDMKKRLELLLRQTNKTIVFMIDNIDRATEDNVIFLFKLIGTVFDMPNMVYVLSYDEERIKDIFKDNKKINPKYIEKIIQQEISIPDISEETKETIVSISTEKLLIHYGVNKSDIQSYNQIKKVICNQITDLRKFKRLLNTAFVNTFCYKNSLYKPHLLAIEVIRFLNPELYDIIKKNYKFFVSRDTLLYSFSGIWDDTKKFNEEGKAFFDNLFENYSEYKALLADMFEYVKRYTQGSDLKFDYPYDAASEKDVMASISSGKFFDLYFSFGTNQFIRCYDSVYRFIEFLNTVDDSNKLIEETKNTIVGINKDTQREWFEQLQNQVDSINSDKRLSTAIGICNSIDELDNTKHFLVLSAEERAFVVIANLLKNSAKERIDTFISEISSIRNIYIIDELISNCSVYEEKGNEGYTYLKDRLNEALHRICTMIIDNKISLYKDEYYKRYNVWDLYHGIDKKQEVIHKYMQNVISEETVFRVIADLINESTGTRGYGYFINPRWLSELIGDRVLIDGIVEKAVPKTDTERFVLMIWKRIEVDNDDYERNAYYSPVPISLKL